MSGDKPNRMSAQKPSGYWRAMMSPSVSSRATSPPPQASSRLENPQEKHRSRSVRRRQQASRSGSTAARGRESHPRRRRNIGPHKSKSGGVSKRSAPKRRDLVMKARAVAAAVARSTTEPAVASLVPHVAVVPDPAPSPHVVRLTDDLQRIDGELYVRAAPVVELMRAEVGLRLQYAMRRVTIHNKLRNIRSKGPVPFGPPRLNLRVQNMLPALTPLVMDPSLSDADLVAAHGKRRGKGRPITDGALSGMMSDAIYPVQLPGETRRVLAPAGPVSWTTQGSAPGGLTRAQQSRGIVKDANQILVPVVVEGWYANGGRKFSSVTPIVT